MVPFTIPNTRRIGSPRRLSRNGRMSGMPPQTAASNNRSIPRSSAILKNSAERAASNALLAVTTGLPASSAARITSPAKVVPPITSTTKSTSLAVATAIASVTTSAPPTCDGCLPASLTAIRTTSSSTPVRAATTSRWRATRAVKAEPTTPCPTTPIRTVERSPCGELVAFAMR